MILHFFLQGLESGNKLLRYTMIHVKQERLDHVPLNHCCCRAIKELQSCADMDILLSFRS